MSGGSLGSLGTHHFGQASGYTAFGKSQTGESHGMTCRQEAESNGVSLGQSPVGGTGTTRLINAVPDEFVVDADAHLLRRVFQNLIANAISYTPRGEVIIGARQTGEGGFIECFVRDNGTGIPADRCSTVFEKHETDPDKKGGLGLGLGLTIVKMFVEAHGGAVAVDSELGIGSTFRFTLPGK